MIGLGKAVMSGSFHAVNWILFTATSADASQNFPAKIEETTAMSKPVITGALLQCSFGLAPCTFTATPKPVPTQAGAPVGNIQDFTPANIPTFGMCQSLANPTVSSATSAASGVLTPMPCVPAIPAPWKPGSPKAKVGGQPVLSADSTCNCSYLGVISVTSPGVSILDV